MPLVYFISHPEVVIQRDVPVTQWDLSEKGRSRWERMLRQPWVKTIEAVFSSNERKAITAAQRLAEVCSLPVNFMESLGEMDRSATGVLEPAEFNEVVEAFFADPERSIRGWERAVDAQQRIVGAVKTAIQQAPGNNLAIVSHGGVGALLKSHVKGNSIHRSEDQPGQGHYFVFDASTWQFVEGWLPIDA